jgi:hypothetical protein
MRIMKQPSNRRVVRRGNRDDLIADNHFRGLLNGLWFVHTETKGIHE